MSPRRGGEELGRMGSRPPGERRGNRVIYMVAEGGNGTEYDYLQRLYGKLGLSRFSRFRLLKRCTFMVLLTWVPVALLAWMGGNYGGGLVATNFFADFAAYAQFVIAMPLFMLAEPIIDTSTPIRS